MKPLAAVVIAHLALSVEIVEVNGEPAMLMRAAGRLDSVYAFTVKDDDVIAAIHVVRNPDKLRRARPSGRAERLPMDDVEARNHLKAPHVARGDSILAGERRRGDHQIVR